MELVPARELSKPSHGVLPRLGNAINPAHELNPGEGIEETTP